MSRMQLSTSIKRVSVILLSLISLAVAACAPSSEQTPEQAASAATATPSLAPAIAEQEPYWEAWRRGPHANTYALEKGPNTYCARCHAPANWDINATIDPAPNCVSCKFPSEDEPRVAEGNPLVPEDEWQSIGCDVCHRTQDGVVDPEVAWRDRQTGYYETLPDNTALCEKCHLNNDTLKHRRDLGDAAHADFQCTDCHDPHDTSAACGDCHNVSMTRESRLIPEHEAVTHNDQCAECHAGAWEAHPMRIQQENNDDCMNCHGEIMGSAMNRPVFIGHSAYHENVRCVACHDASGLEVGPGPGEAKWTTYRTRNLLGQRLREPYQSHALHRSVDCRRCHYTDNPWDLGVDIEAPSYE